jgi:hypothetical protein
MEKEEPTNFQKAGGKGRNHNNNSEKRGHHEIAKAPKIKYSVIGISGGEQAIEVG